MVGQLLHSTWRCVRDGIKAVSLLQATEVQG
jgi:hypothetical protein